MDAQLKKGLLDVCVLAVLRRGESYGYKIIADVAPYIEISESTLYPILKRLESSGAVTAHSREYNGRLRKYYAITEKGQRRILEFIEDVKEFERIYEFILQGGNLLRRTVRRQAGRGRIGKRDRARIRRPEGSGG